MGKTAGRGMCGQRAREGGRRTNIFEGGQMPLFRKMPLIGFNSPYDSRVLWLVR
jgi:large subunit ribosomal protein L15